MTLDRVRPTVVRRRVFENAPAQTPPETGGGGFAGEYDDDESGPPSSVNVARALASLRGHELRRLDEILTHDDEVAPPAPPAPPAAPTTPTVPTVGVGPSIALTELARRMSVTQEELVTALVTRGFFDVTVKAVLPRETAHTAAAMFGWQVEDTDEAPAATEKPAKTAKAKAGKAAVTAKAKAVKAKPKAAKPNATKSKAASKKTAPKPKATPKARGATAPAARRTSRRA